MKCDCANCPTHACYTKGVNCTGVPLETVKEALQDVLNEEQEAYDNLPEGLQESDRGQQMQEYIDALEGVVDSLGELDIEDLYGTIEEIAEG